MKKISIVTPVYNEGQNIFAFVEAVADVFKELPYTWSIIFVDDGSQDESWTYLTQAHQKYPFVSTIRLAKNFGKESAIAAGLSLADGDAVITIDSDLQHPPELITKMLENWQGGNDIVIAVKEERQKESALDRFMAKNFYRIFQWVTETDISGASDFILLDKKVVEALRALPEKLFFYRGVAHWIGFKQTTIPFTPRERIGGVSGWSLFKKIRLALDSLTGFSAKPLLLIGLMMAIFSVFALIVAVDTIISKLAGHAISGFSTLILVILFTGIAILSSLCLLSVYIRQIFYEVKARPRYIIGEMLQAKNDQKAAHDQKAKA